MPPLTILGDVTLGVTDFAQYRQAVQKRCGDLVSDAVIFDSRIAREVPFLVIKGTCFNIAADTVTLENIDGKISAVSLLFPHDDIATFTRYSDMLSEKYYEFSNTENNRTWVTGFDATIDSKVGLRGDRLHVIHYSTLDFFMRKMQVQKMSEKDKL